MLGPILAPFASRRLARSAAGDPELLARQPERHGHVPEASGELWVHAASVGELAAAEALVCRLLDTLDTRIVISTLTHTAAARARERFGRDRRVRHLFAPLDTTRCVRRWLDHTRPDRLLLVETEIWPVLLNACRDRSIPVAMVNARLSERGLRRSRPFESLFRAALQDVDPVLCQSEADRERLACLGVERSRMTVTGNLKFDRPPANEVSTEVRDWAATWAGRPTWVAGSTHAGEEPVLGRAQRQWLQQQENALAVVVPRHPDRAADALATLRETGLEACSISELSSRPDTQAVVVDRMGVLVDLYQCADAIFVGGSLVPGIGGHNLVEAALTGKPVATGPFVDDQKDAAEMLIAADALTRVDSAESLAGALEAWRADPASASHAGTRAVRAVDAASGAVARSAQALSSWLGPGGAKPPG